MIPLESEEGPGATEQRHDPISRIGPCEGVLQTQQDVFLLDEAETLAQGGRSWVFLTSTGT